MKSDQQAEIIRRLHCAAGHLNAVIDMAEADRPCRVAQVLHQLNAVQAALRAAGSRIIHCQAQSSQAIILKSPSSKQRLAELERLQSLYTIFVQHFKHTPEVTHD